MLDLDFITTIKNAPYTLPSSALIIFAPVQVIGGIVSLEHKSNHLNAQ